MTLRKSFARRDVLRMAAVGLAAPFVVAPGRAKASERLVVANWGGSTGAAKKKAFYDPFERETGIPVTQVFGPELSKIKVQVQSKDVEIDVVDVIESWVLPGEQMNLFERLDTSIVPMDRVLPAGRREHYVAGSIWAGGIAYNSEQTPEPKVPHNWAEFFDPKTYPGRRGLRSRAGETLELALLADGVPPAKIYPLDVDRAFRALDRVKPAVSHWISQTPLTISLLQSRECDFTYTYLGRVLNASRAGQPIACRLNNVVVGISWFGVVRGTRHRDASMKFIEFCLRPERQLELANITGYAPAVSGLRDRIDPAVRKWVPDPEAPDTLVLSAQGWAGHEEEIEERYKQWLLT